jgi:hypothetical protein
MSWRASELDALLTQDVDEVVDRGRSLSGRDRTAALRLSLARLATSAKPLDRLKIVLFVQTLLAFVPDGQLVSSVAEAAAKKLSNIVVSSSDPKELKRSALSALALLVLKAPGLTTSANAHMRAALTAARNSHDPEISDFARRAFSMPTSTRRTTDISLPSKHVRMPPGGGRSSRSKILVIHGRDKPDDH